jgi:hypothetical protein
LGEREKDVPPAASEARGEVVRASSSKGLGWPGWPKKNPRSVFQKTFFRPLMVRSLRLMG